MACFSSSSHCYSYVSMLSILLLCCSWQSCYGLEAFGFDIYHRFSDPVKRILAVDELPEMGSLEYYVAMAHHDRVIQGRRLAMANDQTPVTFFSGNETYQLANFGYLHYANVSVGTPTLSFLVALDTGSDLFWLPCDCISCVRELETPSGKKIDLSIYSPNASSTSTKVLCNSPLCEKILCRSASNVCPYQALYDTIGTSSTGILVEDVLHLTTDNSQSKTVDAPITFGCGQVQTGAFLGGGGFNGLFGLGMDNKSVPSILARKGLALNSFSMCFGPDGLGRISFGDKGSSDQGETPFNLSPTYNISITQINVRGNASDLDVSAIFDSGSSFTHLNDPAYTLISTSFNSMAKEKRYSSNSSFPFEYCYELSSNQNSFNFSTVNLTMKGGDQFYVTDPIEIIPLQSQQYIYCLGVLKSEDLNIIGQNFMTGYRIVFDREKMVLGWKASDCDYAENSNALPIIPTSSPSVSPTVAITPEATTWNSNNSHVAPSPMVNYSPQLKAFTCALMMVLIPIFSIA